MTTRTCRPLTLVAASALVWLALPQTASAGDTYSGPCTATSCGPGGGGRIPQAVLAEQLAERRSMLRAAARAPAGSPNPGG